MTANSVTLPRSMVRLPEGVAAQHGEGSWPTRASFAGRQRGSRSPSVGRPSCRYRDGCRGDPPAACLSAGLAIPLFGHGQGDDPRGGFASAAITSDGRSSAGVCHVWRRSGVPDHRRRRAPRRCTGALRNKLVEGGTALQAYRRDPSRRRTRPWPRPYRAR